MNKINTNWGHSVKQTLKTSENVNIIKDQKDWDCAKLKSLKKWQVNEIHDPWLDSAFLKKCYPEMT